MRETDRRVSERDKQKSVSERASKRERERERKKETDRKRESKRETEREKESERKKQKQKERERKRRNTQHALKLCLRCTTVQLTKQWTAVETGIQIRRERKMIVPTRLSSTNFTETA